MTELTAEARKRLDWYLEQVRASLRGCTSVDPQEVELDVTEHIERELEAKPQPIPLADLQATLEKLGSPGQWVPGEELSGYRRIMARLREAPEYHRLACISVLLLMIGFIQRGFLLPTLAVISLLLSRIALSMGVKRNELRSQKWFVYPCLAIIYFGVATVLFLWPVSLRAAFESALRHWYRVSAQWGNITPWFILVTRYLAAVAAAVWCTIVGIVLHERPSVARFLFRPFADKFDRTWGSVIMFIGLGATLVSVAASIIILS